MPDWRASGKPTLEGVPFFSKGKAVDMLTFMFHEPFVAAHEGAGNELLSSREAGKGNKATVLDCG